VETDILPLPSKEQIKIRELNQSSPLKQLPVTADQEIIEFDTLQALGQSDVDYSKQKSFANAYGVLTGEVHVP